MAASVESPKDFGKPPEGTVGLWLAEIRAYEKTFKDWESRARRVVKRYRNESSTDANDPRDDGSSSLKRFNILWSNVQTLQPAVYSRMPKPDITRTHKDRDPVTRAAAQILERAVRDQLAAGGFDAAMRAVRDDYLLVARGTARCRYVPTYGEEQRDKIFLQQDTQASAPSSEASSIPPDGDAVPSAGADAPYLMPDGSAPPDDAEVQNDPDGAKYIEQGEPYRPVVAECVKQEHVPWEDFGHTPAPNWGRVRAVWWREFMTRDQLISRFGEKIGNAVSLSKVVPNVDDKDKEQYGDAFKRGEVYEIWDRTSAKVLWISNGYTTAPLDSIPFPLHLENDFPAPEPFYGTKTTDSLIPVTDYDEYRTQADEIDTLTQRIFLLTRALKIAGAYDDQNQALGKIYDHPETTLVPVQNWAMFADKGGIPGAISFVPIKEVADTIVALGAIRRELKQDIQEITGISDIVRGQSDPSETLGAQEIKRQFVGMRIKDRQDGMERFARDTVRITAEIVAEQFSKETLWEISGWQHTNEARQADKAFAKWQASQSQQPSLMGGQPSPQMNGPPSIGSATGSMGPLSGMSPNGIGSLSMMPPPATGLSPQPAMVAPSPQQIQPPMMPTMGGPLSPVGSTSSGDGTPPLNSHQLFDAAIELIKSDRLRGYNISIETDSMVLQDQQAEKQLGIEFVTSVSGFLKEAVPAAEMYPEMREPLLELLMFGIRQFKAGAQLESVFEALADKAMEQQDQPKPPSPEQQKAQAEAEAAKANLAIEQQRLQLDAQKQQQDAALAQQKLQIDSQPDVPDPIAGQKLQLDAADKDRAHQIEMQKLYLQERELALKERQAAIDEATAATDATKVQQDAELAGKNAEREFRLKVAGHNQEVLTAAEEEAAVASGPIDPAETPQSSPLEGVLTSVAEMVKAVTISQQQTATQLAAMNQDQQTTAAQLERMLAALVAPKMLIKDAAGRPVGVETLQ